ncbi:MAG: helix-turn-helix domain-containing protein [Oscillospiraceae bacterium]|nr:helix-turn-helix domain-containing protein [Oscillospiraceae bacterium]MBR3082962.1 helix-turn-helix domain-containing protein [Oscillospiraceae bacterium]MBR7056528.1 helix-turn-helix domain-containing protein [Oscillospiraceae bacterium]
MSSRIFQSVMIQMKDATDRVLGVVDRDGFVVACSELSLIGSYLDGVQGLTGEVSDQIVTTAERTYKLLGGPDGKFDYAVFVSGHDALARTICIFAGVAMSEAKASYEEKHDRSTFIKNIISDNILPGDVYVRAKELHFSADVPRVVFLIRQADNTDVSAIEVLQNLFPDRQKDFVLSISETDLVLIKEMPQDFENEELLALAAQIEQAMQRELGIRTVIGIGTPARHLRELANRYKEAQVAIEVGKVFDDNKTIIHYENLGLGRIIYQLPTTLCEMFLSEVFKKNPIESLDQETLFTINKFFENNLNVSETSRKLFVHRNTLVYRLEKIKKLTGLDLREFDHAIIFKVALMVKKYLNSQNRSSF